MYNMGMVFAHDISDFGQTWDIRGALLGVKNVPKGGYTRT